MKLQFLSLILVLSCLQLHAQLAAVKDEKTEKLANKHQSISIILGQNAESSIMERRVIEGYDIVLICRLAGNPIWYKNAQFMLENRTLNLPAIKSNDAGIYSCHTKTALHGLEWANLTLYVQNNNKPQSSTIWLRKIKAGAHLKLTCPTTDKSRNITWYLNNTIFSAAPAPAPANNVLWLHNISAHEAGYYACRVCYAAATAAAANCLEQAFHVVVELPSTGTNVLTLFSLANQTAQEGESVQLKCANMPLAESAVIAWYKSLVPVISWELLVNELKQQQENKHKQLADMRLTNLQAVRLENDVTQDAQMLVLRNVQLNDEGWYLCLNLQNQQLNVTSTYVKVEKKLKYVKKVQSESTPMSANAIDLEEEAEGPPKFKKIERFKDRKSPAGSSIELRCPAIGNPMPNITWTRNNTEISRYIGTVKYNKWLMKMEDVITDDSGIYKCTVCNKYGCIEETFKLTILDRLRSPPIQSDKFPQNQTVLVNGTATFECKVVSDLEPYIHWVTYTHRNKSIQEFEELITSNISYNPLEIINLGSDQDQPHLLRLHNVTHADEGWYSCVAANTLGSSAASAYLRVLDKFPTREVHNILRSHPYLITVVAVVVISLFLLGSIFIIYVLRKLKHEKLLKQRIQTVHQWTKKVIIYKPASSETSSCDLQLPVVKIEKKRTTFQTSSGVDATQAFNEYEFPLDSDWEIPRSALTLGVTLGEGAFGRVVRAEATSLQHLPMGNQHNNNNYGQLAATTVAVKMVKEEHTDADMASLVREMEVMKIIGKHVNIINLLGCCSRADGPLWVIVEYAPHGNLKDFLKKHRPLSLQLSGTSLQRSSGYLEEKPLLTEKNLVSFAFQVARGMEYLASRKCIHRDLAARNVLVSDDYVIKIADFGLARDLQDTDYYRKNSNGRLPIKWMAPESLQDKFYDSKSDVWSYGVLLWEIMSYGEQPYAHLMSAEELYSYLISGQRMEKPVRCSLNIYLLMRQCWHFDATARPTFTELVEYLEKIFQSTTTSPNEEYLDLSAPILETPPSSSDEESEPETFQETAPLRYQYTYKLY